MSARIAACARTALPTRIAASFPTLIASQAEAGLKTANNVPTSKSVKQFLINDDCPSVPYRLDARSRLRVICLQNIKRLKARWLWDDEQQIISRG